MKTTEAAFFVRSIGPKVTTLSRVHCFKKELTIGGEIRNRGKGKGGSGGGGTIVFRTHFGCAGEPVGTMREMIV